MVSVLCFLILYMTHVQALRWLGYVTSTPLSLASHGATYKNFTSTFDINPLILYFRLAKIKEWVDNNDSGAVIIPLSGALEYKVTQITKNCVEFHSLLVTMLLRISNCGLVDIVTVLTLAEFVRITCSKEK